MGTAPSYFLWQAIGSIYNGNVSPNCFPNVVAPKCPRVYAASCFELRIYVGKMSSSFQHHFTFRHPLFRRQRSASGEWWQNSVYYLWWEFLRRHEGYRRTCENAGNGKYAKLYADFGNVHGVTFKEWWTKHARGARLFSEPPLPTSVIALDPQVSEPSGKVRRFTPSPHNSTSTA